MATLRSTDIADSPAHPVLERAEAYDVVGFRYSATSAPYGTLDLVLAAAGVSVELHFEGVRDLEVDCGFPWSMGIVVLDVSHLGWEDARVRVQGAEDGFPALRFWAREVRRVAV